MLWSEIAKECWATSSWLETAKLPNQSSSDGVRKFGQRSAIAIGGLTSTSKEGMSLSSYRMRRGPNAKQSQGRGNGRTGGNHRSQTSGKTGSAVRGNARQVMEKYLALAQEASSAGDRIAAEGYFQHAEHYFRLMTTNGGEDGEREHRAQPQPTDVEDRPQPDLAGNRPPRLD